MTDDKDKPNDETPEAKAEGPRGGERLAEARRARQISVLEIAKELHVEESKIRALENNDFEVLGAPVFAKGHLRKYSQLVGVDHDAVLADYYRLTRNQEMPPVIVKRPKPRREFSPGPWVAAVAVLVVLGLAYWLFVERPFAPPVPAVADPAASETAAPAEIEPAEATPAESESAGSESAESGPVDDTAAGERPAVEPLPEDDPAAQPPADEPAPTADTAPPPPVTEALVTPVAGGDHVRLSATFSGDCWTEISDASGRQLFFQLGRSGRTVNVSGPGPLSVLFGDADNVELRVNGEDFTIPPSSRRGRTARFTVSGP